MIEIPSAPEVAIVCGDFGGFTAHDLYDHFTDPDLLRKWWPEQATLDPWPGGSYEFVWPTFRWTLRGEYTAVRSGRHLAFTWNWDHEPSQRPRMVNVYFTDLSGGVARMAIHHGVFGLEPSEQDDRKGILEGWIHFGMRLSGLRSGSATP